MISNSSAKSCRCIGRSLASAARRPSSVSDRIISRIATIRSPSKNMCSVRQRPMPSAPNERAVRASVGVSALARTLMRRTSSAQPISVPNSPVSSGLIIGTAPAITSPAAPSMVRMSPFFSVTPPAVIVPFDVVDADRARAGNAGLAHAARDDRGVRGHAAARGQDALGGVHAVNVLGRGFDANQDRLAARLACGLRIVGREYDLAARRAGRGGQSGRDRGGLGLRVEHRMQELVERAGLDPHDGVLAGEHALVGHVHRHLERRFRRALAVAGLQHPELAALDGELHVLQILVVLLQEFRRLDELLEHRGHEGFERGLVGAGGLAGDLGDVLRRADAGHHVLALGVDQELAVERVLAGRRIAGEGDAGRRRLAHVAEHHRLHVDGGAPVGGNVVEPAISDRALVHPRREDRADRAPELVLGLLRERLAGRLLDFGLVFDDDLAPVVGLEVGVERVALAVLVVLEDVLEIVAVDVEHDVRIHLDEAAIAVVGETLVAGRLGERDDRGVVEAEVEDGVHHARHRGARARADRKQERIGGVAEDVAGLLSDLRDRSVDLRREIGRVGLAVVVEVGAKLGGDGEAGRHRQAEMGHFVQVRALAAEQIFHFPPSFRALGAEGIDPFRHCSLLTRARPPRSSAPRVQSQTETHPAGPVEQKVDAEQGSQSRRRCPSASGVTMTRPKRIVTVAATNISSRG